MKKKLRILLTGGGSGGHIYGLLAIAEELKKQAEARGDEIDMRYFGDPEGYALELQSAGITIRYIVASKIRQYISVLNVIDLFKFCWSIPQSLWKIFWFMPDVACSKGGPGAFAVLLACWFYRIPIVIHDGDAIPGRTSRWTEKFAQKIFLAFPSAVKYFLRSEITEVVGNPIRKELRMSDNDHTKEEQTRAKVTLEMNPDLPLILILGGSQGAVTLNNFVLENLSLFIGKYQIIHQVGVKNFPEFIAFSRTLTAKWTEPQKKMYRPVPFLQQDMKTAFIATDCVISRAGAGALFEIAAAGKPSIIVPIEESANNHQQENAFQYEETGACVVVEEENLFGNIVIEIINEILGNPKKRIAMQEAAQKFAAPEAAQRIAAGILAIKN